MKTRSCIIVSFLVMTIFCFFINTAFCASFFADMVETGPKGTVDSKIIVQDNRYRIDTKEEQKNIHIIVDKSKEKTWILVPLDKIVIEKDINDLFNLMRNPFLTLKYVTEKYDSKKMGHESINGYPCTKTAVFIRGQEAMTAWVSDRLQFPVRIVNLENHRIVDLKNISEKQVKDDVFNIPPDFKKMSKMPVPPPKWAKEIASSPVLTPPFEKKLPAGSIVRIKPLAGYHIKLVLKSIADQHSIVTILGFKDNIPNKDPSFCSYQMNKGQKITSTRKETPGQTDDIVIRVKKGIFIVNATLLEAPEGMILKTFHLKGSRSQGINIKPDRAFRLVMNDDGSNGKECLGKIEFFINITKEIDGGTETIHKKIDDISFKIPTKSQKIWRFSSSKKIAYIQLDIQSKSVVNLRLEQPDKPGRIPEQWKKKTRELAAATVQSNSNTPLKNPPISIIFILDGSGSMWGQINGKPKIQIAKQVMNTLIDKLPSSMRVGLMAYGHRRKGDCSDIEMLLPVGKPDPSAMKKKINAINPKGKTPLSAAVEQAAKNLRYTENKATVILISDGLETCNADPCKLAEKLAMHGVDFTVHVIGFDLSREEQTRLKCMADKTGGLFFAASDAGALQKALFKTVEKVKEPPPFIKEDPGKAVLDAPDSVPAGSPFKVKWQGPDSLRDFISISTKRSQALTYMAYAFTKSGNPVLLTAPGEPGKYELRYIHTHSKKVIGRRDIQVTPVTAKIVVPPEVEAGKQFSVTWEGPAYTTDLITIARPDQNAVSYLGVANPENGNPATLVAPPDPGTYEVRYILGNGTKILARTRIEVKPVKAEIQAPSSVNAASKFQVHWKGPVAGNDLITIARPDQDAVSYLGVANPGNGNPVTLFAPPDPGTYEVRYILGNGAKILARTSIGVKPVKAEIQAPSSVNAASKFQVHWQGPVAGNDLITIARPDQDAVSYLGVTYTGYGNPATLRAPDKPGTYEVRFILVRGAKILARTPIIVKTP